MTDHLREQARAWAERSCLDQGLAVKITDSRTLRDVASLLGVNLGGSDLPHGGQAVGIEAVVPAPTGADDHVVEDGGDDRVLPRQGQVGPALPQGGCLADMPLEDRDAA